MFQSKIRKVGSPLYTPFLKKKNGLKRGYMYTAHGHVFLIGGNNKVFLSSLTEYRRKMIMKHDFCLIILDAVCLLISILTVGMKEITL